MFVRQDSFWQTGGLEILHSSGSSFRDLKRLALKLELINSCSGSSFDPTPFLGQLRPFANSGSGVNTLSKIIFDWDLGIKIVLYFVTSA